MALTVRQDGSVVGGQPNTVYATWWNDYHDLLTGVMTDQDVTHKTDLILAPINGSPSSAMTAALATGSALGVGVYKYAVTYFKQGQAGESTLSGDTTITTTTGNQAVVLSAIPTGPAGVIGRNIYRTAVGGTSHKLLATLNDNTTTTYTDTTPDASLSVTVSPATNGLGGRLIVKDSTGTIKAQINPKGSFSFDAGSITSDGSGNLSAVGVKVGGQPALVLGTGSFVGFHVFVGPNTPTGMVKGDVWLKTPFS